MDELLENLNTILREKEEKILPENIKKGIVVFDIEGEFEPGVPQEKYDEVLASRNEWKEKYEELATRFAALQKEALNNLTLLDELNEEEV